MDSLWQDVRYAIRQLVKHRGFTIVAVLTLALGIGANTAIFSVVDAVLLKSLGYADADHLVSVWTAPAGRPADRNPASLPDVRDWEARNGVFTGIGAYAFNREELTGPEGIDQARAAMGTTGLYTVMGVQPVVGRLPLPAEEREPVMAISHALWMRRYGGDRGVVGRTVDVSGRPFTIVGVMPAGFHFPSSDIDLWTTLYPLVPATPDPMVGDWVNNRGLHGYRVMARLKPGVTMAAAELEMTELERQLGVEYAAADAGTVIRLSSIRADTVGSVQRSLLLLLGAAGFVLLLACANVAHLMMARAASRAREIAVRRALGANRARVIRQLITESVVLSLLGGSAGVLLGTWGTALLARLSPGTIPRLEVVGVDLRVLAFAAAASVATGLVFGVAPALVAWDGGAHAALREQGRGLTGSRTGQRFRSALMAGEVAMALMLVVASGLTIRSFARLVRADTGVHADGVLTFHAALSMTRFRGADRQVATMQGLLDALGRLPGVESVGAATSMPPSYTQQGDGFTIEGRPAPEPGHVPTAWYVPATPGYLKSLGIPVSSGRDFASFDDAKGVAVAIVNRELVRREFGGESPIGHRLIVSGVTRTIVGVSGDATYDGVGAPAGSEIYVPYAQSPFPGLWIVMKAASDPKTLMGPVRSTLSAVDPDMRPRSMRTMDEVLSDSFVRPRFQTWLLGMFGALALALAAVGIYGVIAYGVAQRTGEIGLRLALGATTGTVLRLVVAQGMRAVGVGVIVGAGGAVLLARVMANLLYSVRPTDFPTYAMGTVVIIVVALAASYLPARRATRVDPLEAMRSE